MIGTSSGIRRTLQNAILTADSIPRAGRTALELALAGDQLGRWSTKPT